MLFPPSLPEVFSLSLGFGNLTTMCFHMALPVCISFNIISLQMDVLHEVCKIFNHNFKTIFLYIVSFLHSLWRVKCTSELNSVPKTLSIFQNPFLFYIRDKFIYPESSSWILFLLLVFYNLNLVLNIPSTNFLVKNSPFFFFWFGSWGRVSLYNSLGGLEPTRLPSQTHRDPRASECGDPRCSTPLHS